MRALFTLSRTLSAINESHPAGTEEAFLAARSTSSTYSRWIGEAARGRLIESSIVRGTASKQLLGNTAQALNRGAIAESQSFTYFLSQLYLLRALAGTCREDNPVEWFLHAAVLYEERQRPSTTAA